MKNTKITEPIPYPGNIDLTPFTLSEEKLEAKYGLPKNVVFCKKCVISNQRPNSSVEFKNAPNSIKATINLDKESICDACKVAQSKTNIQWQERRVGGCARGRIRR